MNHHLSEKYWNGETTPQEEQQLREDVAGSTSPEGIYFAMIDEARRQKSRLTIHDIHAYNTNQKAAITSPKVIPLYRWMASAAAVIAFVAAGVGLWNYSQKATQPVQMAETFEDPYEAYAEMREALAFMSSKLNKSQGEAMINIKKAGEYADMFK